MLPIYLNKFIQSCAEIKIVCQDRLVALDEWKFESWFMGKSVHLIVRFFSPIHFTEDEHSNESRHFNICGLIDDDKIFFTVLQDGFIRSTLPFWIIIDELWCRSSRCSFIQTLMCQKVVGWISKLFSTSTNHYSPRQRSVFGDLPSNEMHDEAKTGYHKSSECPKTICEIRVTWWWEGSRRQIRGMICL